MVLTEAYSTDTKMPLIRLLNATDILLQYHLAASSSENETLLYLISGASMF